MYLATRVYAADKHWDTLPFGTLNVSDGATSYHIERRGREFDIVEGLGFGATTSYQAEAQNLRRNLPHIEKRIADCHQHIEAINETRKELERLKTVKPAPESKIEALEAALVGADEDEAAWKGYLKEAEESLHDTQVKIGELYAMSQVKGKRWTFNLDNFSIPGVTE